MSICPVSPVQEGEPEREEQKDIATIEVNAEHDPSLPRAIILDLSPVNFLDTVGVKTLRGVCIRHIHTHTYTQKEGNAEYSYKSALIIELEQFCNLVI